MTDSRDDAPTDHRGGSPTDPHGDQPTFTAGTDLADADAAVLLFHGRAALAQGMLGLAESIDADGVAYLAPQAAQSTWYPNSFLASIESNQPWLDSALSLVDRTVDRAESAGVDTDCITLGGFSQGACLASEYAVRNPTRYGGLITLSGGLIGPEGTTWGTDGSFGGMPAFLGCSDVDPHVPLERVEATIETLESMDADVDGRIYEGMGHTINADEREAVAGLLQSVAGE